MSVYPGAIPPAGSASPSDTLAAAGHTSLHNTDRDEIRALATKTGTGSSTPTSGKLLRGTGTGTSAWAQADLTSDVTGILPVGSGGIGQNSLTTLPLTSPVITGAVSGGATYTSPTLTTPVVADFSGATHTHASSAQGGVLTGSTAITNGTLNSEKLQATIAFKAYRSTALNINSGAARKINLDAELFDIGSNFDSVTNFRFDAPVAGYYQINASFGMNNLDAAGNQALCFIFVNGVQYSFGKGYAGAAGNDPTCQASDVIHLSAGDYVELYGQHDSATVAEAVTTGSNQPTFMSGYFIGA